MGGEKKKKKERRGERRKGSYVGFICVSVCEMARRQASIFFKCALKKKKPARVPGFFLYWLDGGGICLDAESVLVSLKKK